MIPATINVAFDLGKPGSDRTVILLVRGTGAEIAVLPFEIDPETTQGMTESQLVGLALKHYAEQLKDGGLSYTTGAENRGLPAHMLRVVNEFDALQENAAKLGDFIGVTKAPAAPFQGLGEDEKSDMQEQHLLMLKLSAVLARRLARARKAAQ